MNSNDNYAEIDALVTQLEEHLAANDVEALVSDLEELAPCSIFSGNALHRRLKAVREELVLALYRGLPWDRFLRITLSDYVLNARQIYIALDPMADDLTDQKIVEAFEQFDSFPPERTADQLRDLLIDSEDDKISTWLADLIEKDRHIEQALSILSRRTDQQSQQALSSLLATPPWEGAEASWQFLELVRALGARQSEDRCVLIKTALENYTTASSVRRELLEVYKLDQPEEALKLALNDLIECTDRQQRDQYLRWLPTQVKGSEPPEETIDRLIAVSKESWSGTDRGRLARWFKEWIPDQAPTNSGWLDRFSLRLTELFQKVRLDQSCGLSALMIFIMCTVYLAVLNNLIGGTESSGLDVAAATIWIVTALFTSRQNMPNENREHYLFPMAVLLFGSMLIFFIVPLVIRLL